MNNKQNLFYYYKRYVPKDLYKKSRSVDNVGVISEKTKQYFQTLKQKKTNYTTKDISNFYKMLSDDLGLPYVNVKLINTPPVRIAINKLKVGYYDLNKNTIYIYTKNVRHVDTKKTFYALSKVILHEFIHFYDAHALGIPQSPHTSGFFKRLMNLQNQLLGYDYSYKYNNKKRGNK